MAKKQKKQTHHSRPHGGGVSFARQIAFERAKESALKEAARDVQLQWSADRQTQRAMWLMVCSIKDAYGFGKEKLQKFFEALEANGQQLEQWKQENGEEYAWEKLRQIAEHYTGTEIKYAYEEDPLGKYMMELEREKEDLKHETE